jgi:hypothetical protein
LPSTLGERILVLIAERCLGFRLSFSWGHTHIVVQEHTDCKASGAGTQRGDNTVATS